MLQEKSNQDCQMLAHLIKYFGIYSIFLTCRINSSLRAVMMAAAEKRTQKPAIRSDVIINNGVRDPWPDNAV